MKIPKLQKKGKLPMLFTEEQFNRLLQQTIVSDATSKVSNGQSSQQAKGKHNITINYPKTKAEGSYRNIQKRRQMSDEQLDRERTNREIYNSQNNGISQALRGAREGIDFAMQFTPSMPLYDALRGSAELSRGNYGEAAAFGVGTTLPFIPKGYQYISNTIPKVTSWFRPKTIVPGQTFVHPSEAIGQYLRPQLRRIDMTSESLMNNKKPINYISAEELQPEAYYLTTRQAEITHPELVRNLSSDYAKGDIVDALAIGKQVELPLFNNSGVKPNVGTVVEVMSNKRPMTQRYVTTLKGTQPIEGEYKVYKSMGGFDYSAGGENAIDNAIEYIAIDRPWEASIRLGQKYGYGSPQYKYAMDRVNLIDELSRKYGIKWGKDTRNFENINWDNIEELRKAVNPQSLMKNSRGTYDLDMSLQDKIASSSMTPEDFIRYKQAVKEYSQFWGAGKDALQAGGVHQQAIVVPNQMERVSVRSNKPMDYQNLKLGTIQIGALDKGTPLTKIVTPIKGEYNINALAKSLDKNGYPYFSVEALYDPNLGTTHAAKPKLITRGMKKGGRLKTIIKYEK